MSIRRRPVKVATVSQRPTIGGTGQKDLDRIVDVAAGQLRRAAKMGAELIAFPEIYPQLALTDPFHHPEPTESGSLNRIRDLARELKVLVVWPRLEYDSSRGVRNTAVLVDRTGDVIGRYDKMFPTVGEMEKGVVPGTAVPCFETDLGRVAMLICFDMNFREVHEGLAHGQPDIVVFSSMYRGGLQAQSLAFELGSFVITAISSELGLIIDRCGRILKESTYEAIAITSINTNSIALHMDFNREPMERMLERYGSALNFDYHTREAFVVLESTGPQDIHELVREYKLEPASAYWERARKARREAITRFESSQSHRTAADLPK
ncbi:MAG: carbon-nitrogen hydrolase family protein [Isosphaeraceae bacterium]